MKRAGLLVAVVALAIACGNKSGSPGADGAGDDAGVGDDAGDAAIDTHTSACDLAPVDNVDALTPTFAFYDPPASQPPPMTGGMPSGRYAVTSAIVYLPTNTKSVAHPDKSYGRLTSWAVFSGTSYRIFLHASLTIDTSLGPNQQGNDVNSLGSFKVDGPNLTLDYSCDKALPDPLPSYQFTIDGTGKATLVIKSTTTFGDGYLQLEAMPR
jgi:hypothetical protein